MPLGGVSWLRWHQKPSTLREALSLVDEAVETLVRGRLEHLQADVVVGHKGCVPGYLKEDEPRVRSICGKLEIP